MIAFGVDQIQLAWLAFYLPTQYEGGAGVKALCIGSARPSVLFLLGDIELANVVGDVGHIPRVKNIELGVFLKVSLYLRHNRLTRC